MQPETVTQHQESVRDVPKHSIQRSCLGKAGALEYSMKFRRTNLDVVIDFGLSGIA